MEGGEGGPGRGACNQYIMYIMYTQRRLIIFFQVALLAVWIPGSDVFFHIESDGACWLPLSVPFSMVPMATGLSGSG